jgi:hypothetical protein
VEFGKKINNTPSIKEMIIVGTSSFSIPEFVGDMISTGVDFSSSFLGAEVRKETHSKTQISTTSSLA